MRGLGAGGGGAVGEVGAGGGMLERDGQIGLDLKVTSHSMLFFVDVAFLLSSLLVSIA